MATIADSGEVEVALRALSAHESGPFVTRLPRAAGTRDARYAHLLCGNVQGAAADEPDEAAAAPAAPRLGLAERVQSLEMQVERLQQALEDIRSRL